jgi:hypothetical protein
MMYGAKVVLKYMLGLDQAGRNFAVFPDDTLVVSYPRSGNTWTRFLIANLVHPEKTITFANIESLIPDTSSISSRALKRISRPRIIKSHDYFDHRYPKVIYIVRDPRDVALSYYDFQRKYRHIEDKYPLERYVDDFVNGRLISASWGTWAENVGSWIATRGHTENFLLLRFEDMLEDTQRELVRIAQFLNVSVTSETLERAIVNSAADRMRQMEKQEEGQWVATKKHRKDIPFVRVAKAGGWKTNLPAPCVMQIEAAWGELMSSLRYSLVSMSSPEERMVLDSTLSR